MKRLYLAALMLLTAGCGAYQFPGDTPSPSDHAARVSGTVLSAPCSPVEQEGMSCAGRPVPNLEIDYRRGSTVVAKTVTDSQGVYSIDLAPGVYGVALQTHMRVISGPTKLTLAPGNSIVADYMVDSGIRVPVPQE